MIKIKALSFYESTRLERGLNRENIPYNWDFNEEYLGCIDKLYDIEISDERVSIKFDGKGIFIKLVKESFYIIKEDFKEVIVS